MEIRFITAWIKNKINPEIGIRVYEGNTNLLSTNIEFTFDFTLTMMGATKNINYTQLFTTQIRFFQPNKTIYSFNISKFTVFLLKLNTKYDEILSLYQ